jgi:hypothetical protein
LTRILYAFLISPMCNIFPPISSSLISSS